MVSRPMGFGIIEGSGFFILLAEMAIFVGDGAIAAPVPSG